MKKRIMFCIGLLLVTALIFGACGSDDAPDAPAPVADSGTQAADTTDTADTADTPAPPAQVTDVSWFLSVGVVPSTWDQTQYVMRRITEETGVTISAITPAEDPDTRLNLMIVSGDLPDMMTITNHTLIREMVMAEMVWDIEGFFQTYRPDSHLIHGGFPADIRERLEARDGGWYTIPSHKLSRGGQEIWGLHPSTEQLWLDARYRNNNGVVFNRDIMEMVGITEEELGTESGFLDALQRVHDANLTIDGAAVIPFLPDGAAFRGGSWQGNGGALGTLSEMFGTMRVDADGNFQSGYFTEGYRHAVRFLNTAAQRGLIEATHFTWDRAAREAACRAGRVFAFAGNTADTGFFFSDFDFFTPGVILPDTGATPVLGINDTVGTGWLQTLIAKDTNVPEAVASFLSFMTNTEGLIIGNYGEYGIDWETTPDGLFTRTEEGERKLDNSGVTGVFAFWAFHNQNWDRRHMYPGVDPGIQPQSARGAHPATYIYNNAALNQLPGGWIDADPQLFAISNEIYTFAGTALANIILQATDDNFDQLYDEFLERLETLGLRQLDAHVNEAVQQNFIDMGYRLTPVN